MCRSIKYPGMYASYAEYTEIEASSVSDTELSLLLKMLRPENRDVKGRPISFIHPRAISPGRATAVIIKSSHGFLSLRLTRPLIIYPGIEISTGSNITLPFSRILNPHISKHQTTRVKRRASKRQTLNC